MDHFSDDDDTSLEKAEGSSSAGTGNCGSGAGGGFSSIRDRFLFKRNPNASSTSYLSRTLKATSSNGLSLDRQFKTGRSHYHHHNRSMSRKLFWFPIKERSWFYLCIILVIFVFALASMVLQSSIISVLRRGGGGSDRGKWLWFVRDDLKLGSSLHFVPRRRFELLHGLDSLRNHTRIGIRPPRIALVC